MSESLNDLVNQFVNKLVHSEKRAARRRVRLILCLELFFIGRAKIDRQHIASKSTLLNINLLLIEKQNSCFCCIFKYVFKKYIKNITIALNAMILVDLIGSSLLLVCKAAEGKLSC